MPGHLLQMAGLETQKKEGSINVTLCRSQGN